MPSKCLSVKKVCPLSSGSVLFRNSPHFMFNRFYLYWVSYNLANGQFSLYISYSLCLLTHSQVAEELKVITISNTKIFRNNIHIYSDNIQKSI